LFTLRKHAQTQVDVWSAGVLLYVLLVGYPPFNGSTNNQIFESIVGDPLNLKSEPWPRVSSAAKELVRKMLLRDPKRRYTPEQVRRFYFVSFERGVDSTEVWRVHCACVHGAGACCGFWRMQFLLWRST
jgi:serine/threonine protein kinase